MPGRAPWWWLQIVIAIPMAHRQVLTRHVLGSSREQAATAILAKQIPLVIGGSFNSAFARNAINNALLSLSVPRLIEHLRTYFASQAKKGDGEGERKPVLTRRTGWTLTWDVRRSVLEVREGPDGMTWTEKVGELPTTIQAIIAAGGLEAFTQAEVARSRGHQVRERS